MNLDLTSRWLTLVANVGVLAGIIFLAYELQQNTVATQLEAASNFNASFSEIELLIAGNPEFAELLVSGREGAQITGTDQLRLTVFYNQVLRQWQFAHFQYLSGAMDEDNWQAQRAFMVAVIGGDIGLLNHWRESRPQYNSAFDSVLESISEEL